MKVFFSLLFIQLLQKLVVPLGLCQNGCLLVDLFEDALGNLCEKAVKDCSQWHMESIFKLKSHCKYNFHK